HRPGARRDAAPPATGLPRIAAVGVEVLAGRRAACGERGDDGAVADLVVDAGVVGGRVDVDEVAGDATGERRVVPVHPRVHEADGHPGTTQARAQGAGRVDQ